MKWTIATKVNIFVAFAIILPVLFLGWFFIRHEDVTLRSELSLRADTLVQNLARSSECELGVLASNTDDLITLLQNIAKEKDVAYAVIEDKNGTVLAFVGQRAEKSIKEFSAPVITEYQNKDEVQMGTSGQRQIKNERLGTVTLGMSLTEIEQKIANLQRILLIVLAAVIFLSIIGVFFGIRYLINQPLKHLLSSINIIGFGDLSHRVDINSSDEIGTLADSFNMMTENLSKVLVSKNYMNDILESMNDILLVFNPEGLIKTINRATFNFLGYEEDELIGMSFKHIMPHEDVMFDPEKRQQILKQDVIYNNEEKELLKKDGTVIPVFFSATLLYDTTGNVQGIICVAQDITEKKRAAEEKQQLEKRLQLSEKMEALGRLAGGVAHDLNNTLSAIVGYPDLILQQLPPDSPHIRAISTIQVSGQRAADIVQDLLTLARRSIPIKETINLNQLITEYFNSAQYEKLKSYFPGVSSVLKLEENLLHMTGSAVHLSKSLMNLVTNAAEAINGVGTITVSTANRYIDQAIGGEELGLQVGEYILLRVQDTGSGIAQEDLKRIFEPFFSRKKMGRSGSGLGMAVIWGTVKDHNGYIDVKSTPGEGTTFDLFFPATHETQKIVPHSVGYEAYMGNGEKILVVDDIPEQREIASRLLQTLGYTVETMASGEQALIYLKTQTVDLVILDMIMEPGMDGLDTYNGILKIHPHMKAIITSGFAETERVETAQQLGVGAYIQKPYTIEKIGLAVKNQLKSIHS